jgi:hypothetical protein
MILDRLVAMWMQLDAHEALAYEDKVAAQVHIVARSRPSTPAVRIVVGLWTKGSCAKGASNSPGTTTAMMCGRGQRCTPETSTPLTFLVPCRI